MPNGASVRLPRELQPQATTAKPDAIPAATEVETAIGAATAAAVTGFSQAMMEYQNGGLAPATRLANGERIARMYELQQVYAGEVAFEVVARAEARVVLRQYLAADGFYGRHTTEQGDAVCNELISHVLEIVGRVTDFERRLAN
jgi:hypothetical protein